MPQDLHSDVIRESDLECGRLFDTLKRLNLEENTMVIFASKPRATDRRPLTSISGQPCKESFSSVDSLYMRLMGLAMVMLLVSAPAWSGDIEGRVVITRTLTKKRVVVDVYAPRGGAPAAAAVPDELDEWQRTVIYVDANLANSSAPPVARIEQKNRRFEREVLVVPVGTTVSFPNGDPIFHNVFSLSKAKSFDLGYYPQGKTKTVRFDKPGPVQVFCHLHTNMNAAILVVPNAHFAQPSSDGAFRIPAVPAGRRMLRLWHKTAGFLEQLVDVPAEGTVSVAFNLPLATTRSVRP